MEALTHWPNLNATAIVRGRRSAICGMWIRREEEAGEPTCPVCAEFLARQEAEDDETLKALDAEVFEKFSHYVDPDDQEGRAVCGMLAGGVTGQPISRQPTCPVCLEVLRRRGDPIARARRGEAPFHEFDDSDLALGREH